MKRPPINPRTILIANIADRAAAMPHAPLRDIYAQAVDIATCADPSRFRKGSPEDALRAADARRTAWLALGAANRARKAARRPLGLAATTPEGAA